MTNQLKKTIVLLVATLCTLSTRAEIFLNYDGELDPNGISLSHWFYLGPLRDITVTNQPQHYFNSNLKAVIPHQKINPGSPHELTNGLFPQLIKQEIVKTLDGISSGKKHLSYMQEENLCRFIEKNLEVYKPYASSIAKMNNSSKARSLLKKMGKESLLEQRNGMNHSPHMSHPSRSEATKGRKAYRIKRGTMIYSIYYAEESGEKGLIEALVKRLDKTGFRDCIPAELVKVMGKAAIPILEPHLKTGDPEFKEALVAAIKVAKQSAVINPTNKDNTRDTTSTEASSELKELKKLFQKLNPKTKWYDSEFRDSRTKICSLVDALGEKALPAISTALGKSHDRHFIGWAAKEFAKHEVKGMPYLIKHYQSKDEWIIMCMRSQFKKLGPKAVSAVTVLLKELKDDKGNLRTQSKQPTEVLTAIAPPEKLVGYMLKKKMVKDHNVYSFLKLVELCPDVSKSVVTILKKYYRNEPEESDEYHINFQILRVASKNKSLSSYFLTKLQKTLVKLPPTKTTYKRELLVLYYDLTKDVMKTITKNSKNIWPETVAEIIKKDGFAFAEANTKSCKIEKIITTYNKVKRSSKEEAAKARSRIYMYLFSSLKKAEGIPVQTRVPLLELYLKSFRQYDKIVSCFSKRPLTAEDIIWAEKYMILNPKMPSDDHIALSNVKNLEAIAKISTDAGDLVLQRTAELWLIKFGYINMLSPAKIKYYAKLYFEGTKSSDYKIRAASFAHLGLITDPEHLDKAVAHIFDTLPAEDNRSVIGACHEALGRMGPAIIPQLNAIIAQQDPYMTDIANKVLTGLAVLPHGGLALITVADEKEEQLLNTPSADTASQPQKESVKQEPQLKLKKLQLPSSVKQKAKSGQLRLAVLDVTDNRGRPVAEYETISLLTFAKMSEQSDIGLLERSAMNKILSEQNLNSSGMISHGQSIQLGQKLGANYLLAGKIYHLANEVVYNAKLINCSTGKIWGFSESASSAADKDKLYEKIAVKAAEYVLVKLTPVDQSQNIDQTK